MKTKTQNPRVLVTLRLPNDLLLAINSVCKGGELTRTKLIEQSVREYLYDNHGITTDIDVDDLADLSATADAPSYTPAHTAHVAPTHADLTHTTSTHATPTHTTTAHITPAIDGLDDIFTGYVPSQATAAEPPLFG